MSRPGRRPGGTLPGGGSGLVGGPSGWRSTNGGSIPNTFFAAPYQPGDWRLQTFRPGARRGASRNVEAFGNQATGSLWVRIVNKSGTGSNTWTVAALAVPDGSLGKRDWPVYPMPRNMIMGEITPDEFSEADLPLDVSLVVPLDLPEYTWEFTRTGAGDRVLDVKVWSDY